MNAARLGAITTLTALLAAVASPAVADTVAPSVQQNAGTVTSTSNGVSTATVDGTAASGAVGNAGLNMASGALNQQDNALIVESNPGSTSIVGTLSQTGPTGTVTDNRSAGAVSTIGGSAASNVAGNVGVNSSAGTANQQINALVMTGGAANAISNGTGSTQSAGGGSVTFNPFQASSATSCGNQTVQGSCGYDSSVQGSAGTNVSGNLGLNSSAGVLNAQMNAMYLTNGSNATPSTIDQTHAQTFNAGGTATDPSSGNVNAEIVGTAGNATSGNVGINSAAGGGNLQANLTSVVNGVTGGGGTGGALRINQNTTQTVGSSSGATAVTVGVPNVGPNFIAAINSGGSTTGVAGLNSGAGVQNGQINAVSLLAGTALGTPQLTQSSAQQSQKLNSTELNLFDYSTLGSNVGTNAKGILGANSAGGVQNLQSNTATLLGGTGSGSPTYSQSPLQSIDGATLSESLQLNTSVMQGAAGATGIVSFNGAAGSGNQQQNASVLLTNVAGNAAITQGTSGPPSQQSIGGLNANEGNLRSNGYPYDNQSSINGNAGVGASGIVQMNSAAGLGNQQGNNAMFFPSSTSAATGGSSAQNLSQSAAGSATLAGTISTSDITDAGAGAIGVTGFNSTSGSGNQQVNDMVFSASGGNVVSATAAASQSSGVVTLKQSGGSDRATIAGNTFKGASGLVAANSASGAFNQQGSILELSEANLGTVTPTVTQSGSGSTLTSTAANTANIGGNAFSTLHGTASGNVASGAANQQVNTVQVVGH